MIPEHLCTTGKTFKHTIYEKDFKTIEVSVKDISNWEKQNKKNIYWYIH